MQMACGLHRDYVVWNAFYERIGFANLLQGNLDASRLAADPEQLAASVPILCVVLEELAPTHVILCGEAVWDAFCKQDMLDGYACEEAVIGRPPTRGHIFTLSILLPVFRPRDGLQSSAHF